MTTYKCNLKLHVLADGESIYPSISESPLPPYNEYEPFMTEYYHGINSPRAAHITAREARSIALMRRKGRSYTFISKRYHLSKTPVARLWKALPQHLT